MADAINLPGEETGAGAAASGLAALRQDIDRIDEAMHRLLMERGEIIATLIKVKTSDKTGSAFRPGREADMMRRLAKRHGGLLPLDTAEGIWRVIIGTFTYVQKAYSVHADTSGGDGPMRDSARFHFGFTVPYLTHSGAAAVIGAVAASAGDLGMFRADQGAQAGTWWRQLERPDAPKIIARLPFIERPGHPAGTPVYIIAKPLAEAAARDRVIWAINVERWRADIPAALAQRDAAVVASAAAGRGLSLLVEGPGGSAPDEIAAALVASGVAVIAMTEVGSHAARFAISRAPS